MIKEVEIQNTYQEIDGDISSSVSSDITGRLADNGDTLHLTFPKELATGYARVIKLDYIQLDNTNNSYKPSTLLSTSPTTTWNTSEEVVIDLTPIREFVKVIDTSYSDIEASADVKILTAEANIVDFPDDAYSVKYGFPTIVSGTVSGGLVGTTDGWYQLIVLDIPVWKTEHTDTYEIGTIVALDNKLYECKVNAPIGVEVTDEDHWEVVADSSYMQLLTTKESPTNEHSIVTKSLSDIMITRDIKVKYILPLIKMTSFHAGDDKIAYQGLLHLNAMREATIAYLQLGDPIRALETLRKCGSVYLEYVRTNTTKTVTEDRRYTI